MSAAADSQMPDDAMHPHPGDAEVLRPYAGPAGGAVRAAQTVRLAPYMPMAWRRPAVSGLAAVDAVHEAKPVAVAPIVAAAESAPPVDGDRDELPWIDAFLASTPVVPMPVISELVAEPIGEPTAEPLAEPVAEPAVESIAVQSNAVEAAFDADIAAAMDTHEVNLASDEEAPVQPEVVVAPSEDVPEHTVIASEQWPLDDAASDFEQLSHRIDAEHGPEAATLFDAPSDSGRVGPWSDDDFMDIMPVRRSHRTPLSSPALDATTWAERARAAQAARDAEPSRDAERADTAHMHVERADTGRADTGHAGVGRASEAAEALEMLARRVRAGELAVPEFDARMGEPAALVAALAAVLGVRLR